MTHAHANKQARKQANRQTKQNKLAHLRVLSSEMHRWTCYAMCLFSFVSILSAVCVCDVRACVGPLCASLYVCVRALHMCVRTPP